MLFCSLLSHCKSNSMQDSLPHALYYDFQIQDDELIKSSRLNPCSWDHASCMQQCMPQFLENILYLNNLNIASLCKFLIK